MGKRKVKTLATMVLLICMMTGCGMDRALSLEFSREQDGKTEAQEITSEEDVKESVTEIEMIYVHVCGAVVSPGLKELPAGSRAYDALELAGGFTEDADESYVNLAAFVTDGQKLYFPRKGEALEGLGGEKAKVNINAADEETLFTLPGIGSSRAKAILQYRKDHGPFGSIEELLEVPGIKEGIFEQFQDLIEVR